MTDFIDREEYTIPADSHHPAADSALAWLQRFMITDIEKWLLIKEAIYSTALSGNKMANYCVGTIERLEAAAPVSDRYLLGLAWVVNGMAAQSDEHIKGHIKKEAA